MGGEGGILNIQGDEYLNDGTATLSNTVQWLKVQLISMTL